MLDPLLWINYMFEIAGLDHLGSCLDGMGKTKN